MILALLYLTVKKLPNMGALAFTNIEYRNRRLKESYLFLRNLIS
ncbi:MAG: hypothetical protein RL427_530 [Bacteroidota bacterium]